MQNMKFLDKKIIKYEVSIYNKQGAYVFLCQQIIRLGPKGLCWDHRALRCQAQAGIPTCVLVF